VTGRGAVKKIKFLYAHCLTQWATPKREGGLVITSKLLDSQKELSIQLKTQQWPALATQPKMLTRKCVKPVLTFTHIKMHLQKHVLFVYFRCHKES
jgi:hypothetical protein